MPQKTIRSVNTDTASIASPNFALIPGLTLDILTGSGWLDLELTISIGNATGGAYEGQLAFYIDGAAPPINSNLLTRFNCSQYTIPCLCHRASIRLGAGQHTIAAYAKADAAGPFIQAQLAHLTVTELGF